MAPIALSHSDRYDTAGVRDRASGGHGGLAHLVSRGKFRRQTLRDLLRPARPQPANSPGPPDQPADGLVAVAHDEAAQVRRTIRVFSACASAAALVSNSPTVTADENEPSPYFHRALAGT